MIFTERIKQLREECQIPQRVLAAPLGIDIAIYCKIEKEYRKTKREQVFIDELLSLWLAEQVYNVVKNEKHADKALNIVAKKL
jgi:DNA-binding XRE family transcriptional regulator